MKEKPTEFSIKFAGHRGYKDKEIENSKKAFSKAVEEDLDYIEFDVRKTADNIPIIFHDEKINRMIKNQKGKVQNFTLKELKSFEYKDGQKILTLNEFISYFNTKTNYIIDLKVAGIELELIKLIRKNKLERRTIIQTKNKKLLIKLYNLAPDLNYALYRGYMGYLGRIGKIMKLHKILALIFYYIDVKPYPIKYLSSDGPFLYYELISLLRKKDIKIILGALRTHQYIQQALRWNVDIIICNHADNIKKLLNHHLINNS
jgi:glycerophosphoryl diester phosphodiesterase